MRFVFVERFLELEPGHRASALARFDPGDPLFDDHFPGLPLVPGVLLTEAMGQAAGWMLAPVFGPGRWPLLAMIESAKFRSPVAPGDEISLEAEVLSRSADGARVKTTARVAGVRAADAVLVFRAIPVSLSPEQAARFARWSAERLEESGAAALLAAPGTRSPA